MGQRSGDRCGARRARWGAVALVAALVAGCAGGDGSSSDGSASEEPATTAPAGDQGAEAPDGSSESSLTTSTTAPDLPEGSVAVPIDDELVARLPELEGGGRQVVTDVAFDERFCNGTKAPAVPKSQARASYPISDVDDLTVAAYRFGSSDGPAYTASYADAVRECALEASENQGLGVPDVLGSSFYLTTETGDAFVALALYEDVLWVLFQETSAPPVEVDPETLDGFIVTVLG